MERELKFLLEHAQIPPLPHGFQLAQPLPPVQLVDEYLDDRGQIHAAGWRLRRRRAAGSPLQYTLKSAWDERASSPLREREEIECTPEHHDDLPFKIVAALGESGLNVATLSDRLQPYLTLRQVRHSIAISQGDREIALLSVDQVYASAPTLDDEHRWVELEIEFHDSISAEVRERAIGELRAWFAAQPGVCIGGEAKVDRAARLLSITP